MKEHPILFSSPMVRALLDGRKKQTRRIATKDDSTTNIRWVENMDTRETGNAGVGYNGWVKECSAPLLIPLRCPYGQPGDRLWVRENFMVQPGQWKRSHAEQPIHYCATTKKEEAEDYITKPCIHMPRWASRITLEITGVRVEKVDSISEDDAKAEGCDKVGPPNDDDGSGGHNYTPGPMTYAGGYEMLWESINGEGSWQANPWVWVIEFRRTP